MAIEIVVPRLGWSMDEGTFSEWLKQDGDWVDAGDMLFELEGDKATEEIESFDAGFLRILKDAPRAGDQVVVGQLLGFLLEEGEDAPFETQPTQEALNDSEEAVPTSQRQGSEAERPPQASAPRSTEESKVAITPRARRAARELKIDWTSLRGSGRDGRIREQDVIEAHGSRTTSVASAATSAPPIEGQTVPISRVRRTIAEKMLTASQQGAPVTLTTKADATNLVKRRNRFQRQLTAAGEPIPGYTDLIVKLAAAALAEHPQLKSQLQEDAIFIPDATNIAFAVDTPDGLVAPVIHDVPAKTVWEMAAESKRLIELARRRHLKAHQLRGACFTVTNLGSFGVDAFTPIFHLPQSAILGVGRIVREPVVADDDKITPREMMTLSLTFDHRVLDGAPAARFLDTLCRLVRDPVGALR